MQLTFVYKMVFASALLFCHLSITAQTYFVDIENGRDTNQGTIAQPWQRLDTAINRLNPGNVLYVRGGDYTALGQITFQKNGSQQQPISIIGYLNEFPKVRGITIGFSSWVNIEQIEFQGPHQLPANWRDMPDVTLSNSTIINPADAWGAPDYRVEKVLAKYSAYANFFNYGWNGNVTWESSPSYGINIINCGDLKIIGNKIHHQTYGIRLRNESKRISMTRNEIHHCLDGLSAYCDSVSFAYSFGRSVISDNVIHQSFRNGIMLNYGANHNLVANNVVQFSGQNHISTYNLDILSDSAGYNIISNNVVANGGYYAEFMRFPGPSGISMHSPGPGCKVIGNYISFQYDTTLRDGNAMISDNNPHGSEFINNVTYRVKGSGVSIIKSKYNKIIHNTIIQSGDVTTSQKNGVSVRIIEPQDTANIIANNIFDNSKNGGISAESSNIKDQKYIDYNFYNFPNGAPIAGNGLSVSNLYRTIPEFTAFSGFEAFGIENRNSESLVDSQGHPMGSSSPVIGKGTTLYSYLIDKDSAARSRQTPTIGAFENFVITTIGDSPVRSRVRVYPNPVSRLLVIEAMDTSRKQTDVFAIYSLTGHLLFTKEFDGAQMNYLTVQNLPAGLYVFRYGSATGRFIKN